MSTYLSSSPQKYYEDQEAHKAIEKKGIVSILRSDSEQSSKAPSLRRTLSADMSSKKWLAQNGFSSFSPLKKTASSKEITNLVTDSSSSSSSDEGEYHECDQGKKEPERSEQVVDVWSSILLSKKADGDDSSKLLPPPYVHPLVKRSTSALSEKSLEICTESLGSETGSDVFSSNAPSETGDAAEEDKEEEQTQTQQESQVPFEREELPVVKYNYSKRLSPKSFPPPLPSLARCDGPSLHVHSHRENGRLVLEAVSVPSQNYFHAQREDGRLVLTFANVDHEETVDQEEEVTDQKEDEAEEIEEIFETLESEKYSEDEDDEESQEEEEEEMVKVENEEVAKEIGIVMEQASKLPSGVINVHRSALMIKKLMGLDNRNPTWTNKYNKAVHLVDMEEEEEEELNPLAQSLPRPPRMARIIPSPPTTTAAATAASFNTYEYFWRAKPTTVATTAVNPPLKNSYNKAILSNSTPKAYEEKEMVLLRGNKADYLVPLLRGCKEPKRSFLIWEPYCIASS